MIRTVPLLLGLLVPGAAVPVREARVVARLECAAPPRLGPPTADEHFVVRGTVPLPATAAELLAAGAAPFTVRASGGTARVPAQVEIVARRADGTPLVVEVLARVARPADASPGERLRYDVLLDPETFPERAGAPQVPPRVARLVDDDPAESIVLRTRDVFGNVYRADLSGAPHDAGFGSERELAAGPIVRRRRVHATLVPQGTPSAEGAPLPHLMGAHAYIAEWTNERFLSLDLRVHNGATSGSRDPQPVETNAGIVYWRELELVVPRGFLVLPDVHDPFWGKAYPEGDSFVFPIVAPYADGKLHMMGPQAQFQRRMVVVRDDAHAAGRAHLDGAGRAFCVRGEGLWSWFEEETAAFLPQQERLCVLDYYRRGRGPGTARVREEDAREFERLKTVVQTGAGSGYGYVVAPVMGWAHPWFIRIEGGAGGEGIAISEGFRAAGAASVDDLRLLMLLHRMNMSRQPEAQYDRFGDPVGYHSWLQENGRIPFDFRTNGRVVPPQFRLPAAWGPPASAQVHAVHERGLRPPYDQGSPHLKEGELRGDDGNLLTWSPHDGQHLIRYTKQTKALVWLANDALAKDDLLLSAELFRLMFHESPHDVAEWSGGVTLAVLRAHTERFPHQGALVSRDHAWGIDAMCAAYATQSPAWRERQRPWFEAVSDLLVLAAMPSGIVERNPNTKILQTDLYHAAQAFECLFLLHAMRGMHASVFAGVDEARAAALAEVAVRAVDYLFFGPVFVPFYPRYQPDPQNPKPIYGPRSGFGVALNDGWATPPFSDVQHWGPDYMPADALKHDVDVNYSWQALCWAEELTRESSGAGLENRYLKRALDCWDTYESFPRLLESFERITEDASADNTKNWIGFVAKLRALLPTKR